MTADQLKRCKEFLDFFNVSYDGEYIEKSSGGNSCIMNPNTEWKEFLGHSINSVAEAVAEELGKPTKWLDEERGL